MRTAPKFDWKSPGDLGKFLCMLIVGAVAGGLARWVDLPLPFLVGGLLSTICLITLANSRSISLSYPKPLRMCFVALIGTLIGSTVSPELAKSVPNLTLSLLAVVVYVIVAHYLGYVIFRTFGKYDRVTAFYAAMPGGLIEAVELGTKGGGNVVVLTISHFMRVLFVVIVVPLLFWMGSGEVVGSAAGQGFELGLFRWKDLSIILLIAVFGLMAGRMVRMPAGHLIGPMLVSGLCHGTGLLDTIAPLWLLYVAQLFVGVALGAQLSGTFGSSYVNIVKTSLLATSLMLCLSAAMAWSIVSVTNINFSALFLSFAPGGVSEMGLIALSLGISPMMVAAHHVFRIFVTVLIAAVTTKAASRWLS